MRFPFIAAHDSSEVTMKLVLPDSLISKKYGLGVRIDMDNEVAELTEHNNLMYATTVVKGYPECYNPRPLPGSEVITSMPLVSLGFRDRVLGIDMSSVRIAVDGFDVTATASIQSGKVEYQPSTVLTNGMHHVTVSVGNPAGFVMTESWSFRVTVTQLSEAEHVAPLQMQLLQNFPNPFNISTCIPYMLDRITDVEITIYDIDGRQIQDFYIAAQSTGVHNLKWNGTDSMGRPVASGIYLYRLRTGSYEAWRRLVLLK